jgi:hypothetical protein
LPTTIKFIKSHMNIDAWDKKKSRRIKWAGLAWLLGED